MNELPPHEPRALSAHLNLLRDLGLNPGIDLGLAQVIRVLSGMRADSVCLCSGVTALPYATWVLDGMPMSGRLIAHLDPERRQYEQALVRLTELDIRCAGHVQVLSEFCQDVSRHEFGLIIGHFELDEIHVLLQRLGPDGLLVALCEPELQKLLASEFQEACFLAAAGHTGLATLMMPRGLQHQTKRRGRRTRTRR